MIRMIQSNSADHAKAYFTDALAKSDYYTGNDQELQGRFRGRLAERLGLKQAVTRDNFFALCENKNPATGEQLTPRMNRERITGYDINFHCPKSISVLHVLSKDNHVLVAFQDSVFETMKDIEADSKTRIRKKGVYDDRDTGELAWADFVHQTARPVDGHMPDPHLHSHCFVFNATWDEQEQKIKAGKYRDIKRDMPYYQARFHKRLADRMTALGYQVRRTDTSFEIEGVPQQVIDHFSKRTDEIGRVAKEKGITNAKALDGLGAKTRAKKQKGLSMGELKAEWRRQMRDNSAGLDSDKAVRHEAIKDKSALTPEQCIDHALNHCFERASVMQDRRILATACRQAIGMNNITVDAIANSFQQDDRLLTIQQGSRKLCTTREILLEEKRMVKLARDGQGKLSSLYREAPNMNLSDQQNAAVSHVLTTTNRVSIIRGAAGTGKTTLMRTAVELIEKAGKKVTVVAPTARASRGVLKDEGFDNAETVAKLLTDKKMQERLTGQVLWVDEAGLLGTKDMTALLDLATKYNARLILGGDTRQHSSVIRGDALRVLNTVGGIQTAEVSKIYRQKNVQYREAVEHLSNGRIKEAFDMLDGLDAIKTVDPLNPHADIVEDYIKAVRKGKSALVVSPTHKAGEEVTDEIRKRLRKAGMIGKKELVAVKCSNLNFTEAEKGDWRNYRQGQIIQFNQNLRGIKRGSQWTVNEASEMKIILSDEKGKTIALPLNKASYFDVCKKTDIGLSKGDQIMITRNGFDKDDKRLNNGTMLDVVSVSKKGKIVLRNAASKATYTLDKDFGHITHAHVVTSHASQGKTVDEVFIAQPSSTFGATDLKQFYVSVSRGRDGVSIYTDDREALLDHASELGDRQSALELVGKKDGHIRYVQQRQRSDYSAPAKSKDREQDKYYTPETPTIDIDYEPEF